MRLSLKLFLTFTGVLLVLALVGLLLSSFKFDGSVPGDSAVIAVAPDPRYEWKSFPVAGLLLCKPADSTGTTTSCIVLPEGALLLILTEVKPGGPQPRGPGEVAR
jgi:hypothetical protein